VAKRAADIGGANTQETDFMQHETNFSCMKPVSLVPCVKDAKLMPEMLQNKGLRYLFVGMCFKIRRTSLEALRFV
jgi:hypothetical protein